ncbi:hypothetical protein IC762_15380 [Bradyrhizobium genosp. L]|nr:hypothetical protein IC762_15380 [Bradyrhizobium genosp. L]
MIFEAVLFGIILLAVGYWVTMFVMGRRDDVLHGHFVQQELDTGPVRRVAPRAASHAPAPRMRPAEATPEPSKDSLQALLTVIKQDLQDAART